MTEHLQDTSSPPEASEEAARARRRQALIDADQGAAELECLRLAQELHEKYKRIFLTARSEGQYNSQVIAAMQVALLDAMAWVKP